ncbi:hypothetical protein ACFE04_008550 [Oxalis oulophora]
MIGLTTITVQGGGGDGSGEGGVGWSRIWFCGKRSSGEQRLWCGDWRSVGYWVRNGERRGCEGSLIILGVCFISHHSALITSGLEPVVHSRPPKLMRSLTRSVTQMYRKNVQQQVTFKQRAECKEKRVRPTLCFKGRPLPDFCKERGSPNNYMKKTLNPIHAKKIVDEQKFKKALCIATALKDAFMIKVAQSGIVTIDATQAELIPHLNCKSCRHTV